MNYELVASQFLRALRGPRSQPAFSRRLGYRSNVAYTWESGGGFPTAARVFQIAAKVGIDPGEVLERFYRQRPPWPADTDFTTQQGVARLLSDLRGRQTLQMVAAATGHDRFAVSRWLSGKTEPRWPDFLRLVEACTLRLLDFIAAFVDPHQIPEASTAWDTLELARRAALDAPWSHAILRALELSSYRELPAHEDGWLARVLGISPEEERRCLEILAQTGQIRKSEKRYEPTNILTIDTRRNEAASRHLAAFCAELARDRIRNGASGFAFNVFGVSRQDLARLRQLQRQYFAELRAIVAESKPVECVVVANLHLFALNDV